MKLNCTPVYYCCVATHITLRPIYTLGFGFKYIPEVTQSIMENEFCEINAKQGSMKVCGHILIGVYSHDLCYVTLCIAASVFFHSFSIA